MTHTPTDQVSEVITYFPLEHTEQQEVTKSLSTVTNCLQQQQHQQDDLYQ